MRIVLALLALALFAACAKRQGPAPEHYTVLRTYGWESTVSAPQAEWNPASYMVLARAAGGFALLDEGGGKQIYYGSSEGRVMSDAVWLSPAQFVFGPERNVIRTADGTVVPSSEGLMLVKVHAGRQPEITTLSQAGWRPRPWGETVICQVADTIQQVDTSGRMQEFGRGFNPEPQPKGQGICWMDKPVLEPDYWTATPGLGQLVIRWRPGQITTIPAAVEARWTVDGGVVATVLRAAPPTTGPWWSAGTELVFCSGPGAKPVVIASEVHAPAPHPQVGLVAATANDGRLVLIDLGGRPQAVLADQGERPRWSADGVRLLAEEPLIAEAGKQKDAMIYLRVYVLSTTAVAK